MSTQEEEHDSGTRSMRDWHQGFKPLSTVSTAASHILSVCKTNVTGTQSKTPSMDALTSDEKPPTGVAQATCWHMMPSCIHCASTCTGSLSCRGLVLMNEIAGLTSRAALTCSAARLVDAVRSLRWYMLGPWEAAVRAATMVCLALSTPWRDRFSLPQLAVMSWRWFSVTSSCTYKAL